MTNIDLEVSNVKIEQTEDVAQLEVSRTAVITVKELTIDNLLEAQAAAGAPADAPFTTQGTIAGYRIEFAWTD